MNDAGESFGYSSAATTPPFFRESADLLRETAESGRVRRRRIVVAG